MNIDLKVGDIILGGRFKNKRMKVKEFGKDDLGQYTVNGRKLLSYRLEKLMPKDKQSRKTQDMNKTAMSTAYVRDKILGKAISNGADGSKLKAVGKLFSSRITNMTKSDRPKILAEIAKAKAKFPK